MYDAIVVGARCAGASTAMLLARAGHRVLLVDKASFPSDTLSTHLLKPRAMAYLQTWRLRDQVAQRATPIHERFVFRREQFDLDAAPTAESLRRAMAATRDADPRDEPAYRVELACVRRFVLDDILVTAAVAAGAELRDRTQIEGLVFDSDRVVGVRLRGGGEERARVVIGADGRHSKIASWVAAPLLVESTRCTYTVYSYYADIPPPLSRPGVFLRGRLGVGLGETNAGLTMISVFGPLEWFEAFRADMEGNLLASVEHCFPELAPAMRQGRRAEKIYGTADLANAVRVAHGPGWILVGDAGCHLDQCTAIGITHAFRDAALAAHWLDRGLRGEQALDVALAGYDERRLAEVRPQFDYVSTVSECNIATLPQLAMFSQLVGAPELSARFLGFGSAIVPRTEYFSAQDIDELVAAGMRSGGLPSQREWAERTADYARNPWVRA